MKYKGIELEEFKIDKPVAFNRPKRMLVWNTDQGSPVEDIVFAYIPERQARAC